MIHQEKIVKDDNNDPVIIQKLVAKICPREVHNELIETPENGGFSGARDGGGNFVISETAMRGHWPN